MKDRRKKCTANARRIRPLRTDPTRTGGLANAFAVRLRKKFVLLKGAIVRLLVADDAFGLTEPPTSNAFFGLFGKKAAAGVAAAGVALGAGDNCGIGPGGFQPGNTCARGGHGGQESKEQRVARLTATPQFKEWFGDSKVVDKAGNPQETASIEGVKPPASKNGPPVVVYHGTPRGEHHEFKKEFIAHPDSQHFGPGFYFTEDVEAAKVFAHGGHSKEASGSNPVVMSFFLKSSKPFDADKDVIDPSKLPPTEKALVRAAVVQKAFLDGGRSDAVDAGRSFDRGDITFKYRDLTDAAGAGGLGISKTTVQKLLIEQGHDSITTLAPDAGKPGTNRYWIVFEPTQIKSTENKGNFSPTDPNTLNVQDWLFSFDGILPSGFEETTDSDAIFNWLVFNWDPNQKRDSLGRFARVGSSVQTKVTGLINKLPSWVRKPMMAMIKASFAVQIAANKAVQAVAKEKGLDAAKIDKLKKMVAVGDVASSGSRGALAVAALGMPALAVPAMFFPFASAGYLLYSSVRNPIATLKAATKAIGKVAKKVGPTRNALVENADRFEELAAGFADAMEKHDWSDWYSALLACAFRHVEGDLKAAITIADAAWEERKEGPSEDVADDDDAAAELFADWDQGVTDNQFCQTGPGGGVDPSCGKDGLGHLEGSKGIERKDMPQLKHGDQERMVKWMQKRGVKVTHERVLVTDLKPLQKDYDPKKVRDKPLEALKKPIIISRGGRILDGTHHWLKAIQEDWSSVPVIRLDLGWRDAFKMMHEFPKTFTAALVGNALLMPEGSYLTIRQIGSNWLLLTPEDIVVTNMFCPTGEGGGVDPTCGKGPHTDADSLHSRAAYEASHWTERAYETLKIIDLSRTDKLAVDGELVTGIDHHIAKALRHTDQANKNRIDGDSSAAMADHVLAAKSLDDALRIINTHKRYEVMPSNLGRKTIFGFNPEDADQIKLATRYLKYAIEAHTKAAQELSKGGYTANMFCPTGPGGGVDPTCGRGGAGKKPKKSKAKVVVMEYAAYSYEAQHNPYLALSNPEIGKRIRQLKHDARTAKAAIADALSRGNQQDVDRLTAFAKECDESVKKAGEVLAVRQRTIDKLKPVLGVNSEGLPDVASAVGAPDNATVKIRQDFGSKISISVDHPKYYATRTINLNPDGTKTMHNDYFAMTGKGGSGLGASIFTDQVENLIERGFSKIETHAAKGEGYNGYYTWPRLGYDQAIDQFPYKTRKRIKEVFPQAASVLDIMAMPKVNVPPEDRKYILARLNTKNAKTGKPPVADDHVITGSDWWYAKGAAMQVAEFDLREGSRSRAVLAAYLSAKSKPITNQYTAFWMTLNDGPPESDEDDGYIPPDKAEEIELSPDDEDNLDEAWRALTANYTTNAGDFSAAPSAEKLKAFTEWLESQYRLLLTGYTEEELWRRYIEEGFKKGAGRAFDDTRVAERAAWGDERLDFYKGSREQFLQQSFGAPESVDKVKLLAGRSFDDLKGMTADMSLKLGRILTDGLVQGMGPREVARKMADQLDISRQRAELIARTELIRAHAEGQLTGLEKMGVESVGVAVEWATARDEKVCPLCADLEGIVLKVSEAHGLIPRHPRCRCAFMPANVGEDTKRQIRSKTAIDDAISGSRENGWKKDTWGKDLEITSDRPKSLLDNALGRLDELLGQ